MTVSDSVYGKSQWVRLIDMFVLGPFMIWYALVTMTPVSAVTSEETVPRVASLALFVSGVLTIVYNGINWWQIFCRRTG